MKMKMTRMVLSGTLAAMASVANAAEALTPAPQAAQQAPQQPQPAPQAPPLAPSPQAPQRPQKPQPLPLRVVNRAQFCGRLAQVFANYGAANGYDRVQTAMLANGATAQVVAEFRNGRATDYINAGALAAYSNVPSRAPQGGYLPLANFVGQAMGLGNNVALALSTGELRFIPFAQKGMDLVVIAQNAAALTPERAKKVAEVAGQNGIHIHIVWVGPEAESGGVIEEARSLAWLAAVTGGAFANLSGRDNPCALAL